MQFRLSKIITKSGDQGITRLGDRSTVSKSSERIMAIGSIDETNTAVGVLRAYIQDEDIVQNLIVVQHQLLVAGSELAGSNRSSLEERHIEFLEHWAKELISQLDPVQDFVLPGGSISAVHCHTARVTCRRAERFVVACMDEINFSKMPLKYLNRLSDVLFVLARVLNKQSGIAEIVLNRNI